jgi:hypothetical protein
MRVAGIPAPFGGIDPACELHADLILVIADRHRLRMAQVFRSAPTDHRILAVGQAYRLTVGAINLRLEK